VTAPTRKPRPGLKAEPAAADSRLPVLRLMPALIVAALFMLGFRIQIVVRDVAFGPQAALAQAQPAAPAETAEAPAEESAPAAEGEEGAEAAAADGTVPAAGTPVGINPTELSASEIDTLQRLAERREFIDRREREMQQKESLVQAAEQRLDQKIAKLQEIEKQLENLAVQYDAKKKSEIEQLVRIYTAMKPKDAARIFDDLEMTILVAVVTNMKEAKVAPVLSAMNADKARALTEEMSSRKQIPGMPQAASAAPTP
jgi:flagellar motility protein MotE (MotC chaperone)